jgi:hypothetical protein
MATGSTRWRLAVSDLDVDSAAICILDEARMRELIKAIGHMLASDCEPASFVIVDGASRTRRLLPITIKSAPDRYRPIGRPTTGGSHPTDGSPAFRPARLADNRERGSGRAGTAAKPADRPGRADSGL